MPKVVTKGIESVNPQHAVKEARKLEDSLAPNSQNVSHTRYYNLLTIMNVVSIPSATSNTQAAATGTDLIPSNEDEAPAPVSPEIPDGSGGNW